MKIYFPIIKLYNLSIYVNAFKSQLPNPEAMFLVLLQGHVRHLEARPIERPSLVERLLPKKQ